MKKNSRQILLKIDEKDKISKKQIVTNFLIIGGTTTWNKPTRTTTLSILDEHIR